MPNDDYIKRSDAIALISQLPAYHGSEGAWVSQKDTLDTLNAIPAVDVEPKRRWIPVTERLPEKDGEYWVYTEDEVELDATYDSCIDEESERFGFRKEHYDPVSLGYLESEWIPIKGVTHWTIKPEPPEGEEDG